MMKKDGLIQAAKGAVILGILASLFMIGGFFFGYISVPDVQPFLMSGCLLGSIYCLCFEEKKEDEAGEGKEAERWWNVSKERRKNNADNF